MKKLLVTLSVGLLITSAASASFPSRSSVRIYHADPHVSVGYIIQHCHGGFTGPGPTSAFTHTHIELLDYCSGGVPLEAIDVIEAECKSSFSTVEEQLACIEFKVEKAVEAK